MSAEDFAKLDGIEIPDDLLEGVAGGELNEKRQSELLWLMEMAKARGWSLSDFLEHLQKKFSEPYYADYLNEAIAFTRENW